MANGLYGFFKERDFVVIEIGSKIFELAILARLMGAKRVVLSRILFRSGEAAGPRNGNLGRGKTVKQHQKFFNSMALIVHRKLHEIVRKMGSGLFMNYQEGLVQNWKSKLCD